MQNKFDLDHTQSNVPIDNMVLKFEMRKHNAENDSNAWFLSAGRSKIISEQKFCCIESNSSEHPWQMFSQLPVFHKSNNFTSDN